MTVLAGSKTAVLVVEDNVEVTFAEVLGKVVVVLLVSSQYPGGRPAIARLTLASESCRTVKEISKVQ